MMTTKRFVLPMMMMLLLTIIAHTPLTMAANPGEEFLRNLNKDHRHHHVAAAANKKQQQQQQSVVVSSSIRGLQHQAKSPRPPLPRTNSHRLLFMNHDNNNNKDYDYEFEPNGNKQGMGGTMGSEKRKRRGNTGATTTTTNLSFFQLAPNDVVPVSTTTTSSSDSNPFDDIGTLFIYSGPLFREDATPIGGGSGVSGVCRKMQKHTGINSTFTLLGSGLCAFTYTLGVSATAATGVGMPIATIDVKGEMFDLAGGTLSVGESII